MADELKIGFIYNSTQFSKLNPSTLNKSLSLETTIKLLNIAVAAIKISSVCMGNPLNLRSA
jgi:hypothetical protein